MTVPRASTPSAVFVDFDGTITRRDVTDAILEAYADPAWRQIETAWTSGRISSRECLAAQMQMVTATRSQIDALLDDIEVDPGFMPLCDHCVRQGTPLHILSDGFDYCINRVLSRPSLRLGPLLERSRIVSSHLEPDGVHWRVSFVDISSCVHGCATCKPGAMSDLNPTGGPTVFIGDGLSDIFAAACANRVFAKDRLAAYCDTHAIPYTPYDTLASVAKEIGRPILSSIERCVPLT